MNKINSMHSSIKQVSITDIKEVIEIYESAKIYMLDNNIDQWDEIYPTEQDLHQDIIKRELHGIYIENKLCGVVALNNIQDPEYSKIIWEIGDKNPLIVHRLCINPENKNKGLAYKLMTYTEYWAKTNGYKSIRLDAFIQNPKAVRLYERLNYKNVGIVHLRKGQFYCFEKKLS